MIKRLIIQKARIDYTFLNTDWTNLVNIILEEEVVVVTQISIIMSTR